MVSTVDFSNTLPNLNPNPNPNSNTAEHQEPTASPQISSSPHRSYSTAQMDGHPRSPFEQGSGAPSTSQPYAPTTQDGATSNQYPQYSYDIQLRYPQDPNRSPYPQDTVRQYDPTRSYSENAPRQYTQDASRPYSQDVPRQYAQDPPHPYREEYPPVPVQDQSAHSLPSLSAMAMSSQDYGGPTGLAMDVTGQIAPPGMKPRVTATLWEDEGTLCFQVDVNGMCVARREDNHMINGTKLLNVAQMTRGRRDGILKAEKQKHVVKIGPMHLKGVWIPYQRALEFANKENITHRLYPLFVHNIGALLYHPINNSRGYPASHVPRRQDEARTSQQSSQPGSMAPGPAPVLYREDGTGGVYS